MKTEFEMTEEQHSKLIEACQPVPYIIVTGGAGPPSPQRNANAAWQSLGDEMGFKHMTVERIPGKVERLFRAEPKEQSDD